MYFDEFHNHKWARQLDYARRLLCDNRYETFYRGVDLPEGDIYPGMRVMAAYWVSVEHEMRMRLASLLQGAGHLEWYEDPQTVAQAEEYFDRFLQDMRTLVAQRGILRAEEFDALLARGIEIPKDWVKQMGAWQQQSEAALESGELPPELVEAWFDSCLRSVANYNRYLIWGGVCAARLVKEGGLEALMAAVDATGETFKWAVSREFYVNVLPAAGFEDVGDIMEVGMRGMYSDQFYQSGEEQELEDGSTIKHSILKNCELAGIYLRVAEWSGLPTHTLGYGICRYCEVHGDATMQISIPPMYSPTYRLLRSIGMHGEPCTFELTLTPADDMERLMSVHARVFGEAE